MGTSEPGIRRSGDQDGRRRATGASTGAAVAADLAAGMLDKATLGGFGGGAVGGPAARVVSPTRTRTRGLANERRVEPVKLDRIIAQLQEQPDKVRKEADLDDPVRSGLR